MDLFEKMGEELTNAGKEIMEKSKGLTGAARLHGLIAAEEYKIKVQ